MSNISHNINNSTVPLKGNWVISGEHPSPDTVFDKYASSSTNMCTGCEDSITMNQRHFIASKHEHKARSFLPVRNSQPLTLHNHWAPGVR